MLLLLLSLSAARGSGATRATVATLPLFALLIYCAVFVKNGLRLDVSHDRIHRLHFGRIDFFFSPPPS